MLSAIDISFEGLILNIALAAIARGLKALDFLGAAIMALFGIAIYSTLGWQGYIIPITFFLLGSFFTRLGYASKKRLGAAEKREGKRGAGEVLANGIVPTAFALASGLSPDGKPFLFAYVAGWATALCDTSSTELGSLLGKKAFLLKNFKATAPGTPGAISFEGTLLGMAAALAISSVAAGLGLVSPVSIIPLGIVALAASLAESLIWEYTSSKRAIVHHALNLTNTLIGGCLGLALGFATAW